MAKASKTDQGETNIIQGFYKVLVRGEHGKTKKQSNGVVG